MAQLGRIESVFYMLWEITVGIYLQKIIGELGGARKLWPKNDHADTLRTREFVQCVSKSPQTRSKTVKIVRLWAKTNVAVPVIAKSP